MQPSCDGLIIDPCVPSDFGSFRLVRKFREAVYYIDVQKPDGVQKGVQKIIVGGREIEGNLIPLEEGKTEYHVTVYMG